jgi:hypothetical protein
MFSEHECFCRTRGFNCEQGKTCPFREPARKAPRIPRQHYAPETARPYAVFIFVAIVAVLCAMALVNVATQVTL